MTAHSFFNNTKDIQDPAELHVVLGLHRAILTVGPQQDDENEKKGDDIEHLMTLSEHFTEMDFDCTGQTIRVKNNTVLSLFSSPSHLLKASLVQPISKPKNSQSRNTC